MYIKLILIILVIMLSCYQTKEGLFVEEWATVDFSIKDTYSEPVVTDHYKELMDKFNTIFPDNNRNAGGVQFYEYIHSHSHTLTKDKFMLYHTFYCAVSGSPIDPDRKDRFDYVKVEHIDGSMYVGKYYRCCTPCLADIMKYTKVEHHTVNLKDGPHEHMVLTIGDPCKNESEIPTEVTSFKCSDGKTTNGKRTISGRLIIGVLHEYEKYEPGKHDETINPIIEFSKDRMNTDPNKLQGGMGDIFVKLAIIN